MHCALTGLEWDVYYQTITCAWVTSVTKENTYYWGQSHHTSITDFVIWVPRFGKYNFCFQKNCLPQHILQNKACFLKVQFVHYQKKSTKTYAVSDLTEINRVYGCQGSKTMKMGVHFSTSFFLMLYQACSPFCSFFPWGELWFPWCTTPVIFNTNTVNWFTCLEKPL